MDYVDVAVVEANNWNPRFENGVTHPELGEKDSWILKWKYFLTKHTQVADSLPFSDLNTNVTFMFIFFLGNI